MTLTQSVPIDAAAEPVTLSDLQMDVMRVLWRHGESGPSEVTRALRPGRDLALTTVSTLLTRLGKRGLVAHLVREDAISAEDLAAIRKLLDAKEAAHD